MISFTHDIITDPKKLRDQLNVGMTEQNKQIRFDLDAVTDSRELSELLNLAFAESGTYFNTEIVNDSDLFVAQLNIAFTNSHS